MARRGDWRRGRNIIASPTTVVAGLDPAIHFATRRGLCKRRKWILVSNTRMTEEWVEPPLSRAPLALAEALQEGRSEEHTSELQSLMRISYAVFCLKNKTTQPVTSTH